MPSDHYQTSQKFSLNDAVTSNFVSICFCSIRDASPEAPPCCERDRRVRHATVNTSPKHHLVTNFTTTWPVAYHFLSFLIMCVQVTPGKWGRGMELSQGTPCLGWGREFCTECTHGDHPAQWPNAFFFPLAPFYEQEGSRVQSCFAGQPPGTECVYTGQSPDVFFLGKV